MQLNQSNAALLLLSPVNIKEIKMHHKHFKSLSNEEKIGFLLDAYRIFYFLYHKGLYDKSAPNTVRSQKDLEQILQRYTMLYPNICKWFDSIDEYKLYLNGDKSTGRAVNIISVSPFNTSLDVSNASTIVLENRSVSPILNEMQDSLISTVFINKDRADQISNTSGAIKLFKDDNNSLFCLNFMTWYYSEYCHYLLNLSKNRTQFIRVVFPDSGYGNNTQTFKNQLLNLILLSNQLNRPALFISKEPDADNHFIAGVVNHSSLMLMNPLGITTHKACYQTLAELRTEQTLQTIWMSNTSLQQRDYEEEGLVSSGPITVEWVLYVLQHRTIKEFDVFWNTLDITESSREETTGLIYHGIDLDTLLLLPQTLLDVRQAHDKVSYVAQVVAIRQSHYEQLSILLSEQAKIAGKEEETYLAELLESAPAQVLFNQLMTNESTIQELPSLLAYQQLIEELSTRPSTLSEAGVEKISVTKKTLAAILSTPDTVQPETERIHHHSKFDAARLKYKDAKGELIFGEYKEAYKLFSHAKTFFKDAKQELGEDERITSKLKKIEGYLEQCKQLGRK